MSSEVQQQIQQDWENREFIEIVSQGIKKIAEFLNDFGEQKWRQHGMQRSILSFSLDLLLVFVTSRKNQMKVLDFHQLIDVINWIPS